MSDDWWIRAALANDYLVVDMLMCIRNSTPTVTPATRLPLPLAPPPQWSVRQPRSRPISLHKPSTSIITPTIPFSYNAAPTSESNDIGKLGVMDPSEQVKTFKSEVGETSVGTATKKSGKRKITKESVAEGVSLDKERMILKIKIRKLGVSLEKGGAMNETSR